jgi:oxygen-dependent protoporphyrinogen oxidase
LPKRVAIIGGGITGLAAAYELERCSDVEIDLYEGQSHVGGKIRTDKVGEFLVEAGPDCFFSRKPGVNELIAELGIEREVIRPLQKEFMMLVGGNLHRVPGGLVTLTYSSPDAVNQATFLTEEAKSQVSREVDQPSGTSVDESIRSFFTRRFGPEFSRLVAEPLLAGTHGGDPELLSMRALYPGYFNLERKYGSLTAGMQTPKPTTEPSQPSFLSFRNGMQSLIDHLANSLVRTSIHCNSTVKFEDVADRPVIVAIPANRAADFLAKSAPKTSEALRVIKHRSSAIVTLAYDRSQINHPLNGTGFLVPPGEPCRISGATWSSQKWAGRAPEGSVLMRIFMKRGLNLNDDDLIKGVLDEIVPLLGIDKPPLLTVVTRWDEALPQYEVGHLERMKTIEASVSELPQVVLAGTSFYGVGVPDCIKQGRQAAQQIAERL